MIKKFTNLISKFWIKSGFFVLGIGSLIWFFVRVIPKPSRATYPCMKVAAPMASTFVTYLLGLTAFTFFMRKTKQHWQNSKFRMAVLSVMLCVVAGTVVILNTTSSAKAVDLQDPQEVNKPVGVGKGVFPGRVVWVHNPDATNEDCENSFSDMWWSEDNTDETIVDQMVSRGIQELTGTKTDKEAWDSIFHNYNRTHGRGNVGYTKGEKIVIKTNVNGGSGSTNINTSPQVSLAILFQLVSVVGVTQSDIGIGDPNCPNDDATRDICATYFPNVKYWGYGTGYTQPTQSTARVLKLSSGDTSLYLPKAYVDATYMINLPVFKKHHRAGISLCCKNHFGSIGAYAGGAWIVHPSLPFPDEVTGGTANDEYGVYRCFVDIMGHKDLGGKTILYLIDGLWSSINWGHPPIKWEMSPFNGDWPSSLFLSLDPVAIESVGYDFLYNEFDEDHPTEGTAFLDGTHGPYSHFNATDDYLHQGADPANWPSDIEYDPEQDGTILESMGVHEHWNNATDKKYTRNLGTGNGIELVYVYKNASDIDQPIFNTINKFNCSPNPFVGSTNIKYNIESASDVTLRIYSNDGRLVKYEKVLQNTTGEFEFVWDGADNNGNKVAAGTYICSVQASNATGTFNMSDKVIKAK